MDNLLNETLFSNKTGRPNLPIQGMDLTGEITKGRPQKKKPYRTMEDVEREERMNKNQEEEVRTEEKQTSVKSTVSEVKIGIKRIDKIELVSGYERKSYDSLDDAISDLRKFLDSNINLSDFNNGEYERSFSLNIKQNFSFT